MAEAALAKEHLLNSRQMADFVFQGFLRLDSVVPPDLCEQAIKEFPSLGGWAWEVEETPFSAMWNGKAVGKIFRLPRVRGLIQSLVGPDPRFDHSAVHLVRAREGRGANLHQDNVLDPRDLAFDIQLSFFAQDITPDMGGTLFVPGTHFRKVHEGEVIRYQNILGQTQVACPAGTVYVWHHNIWHSARSNKTGQDRYMFKVRLNPTCPQRLLWNHDDLHKPETQAYIRDTFEKPQPFTGVEARLDILHRLRLWRHLTGDEHYDYKSWLNRFDMGL